MNKPLPTTNPSIILSTGGRQSEPASSSDFETIAPDLPDVIDATPTDSQPELGSWGIDLHLMNTEIAPGDNFAGYVNGHWLDTFEIPADLPSYSVFLALRERSTEQVNQIINNLSVNEAAASSLEQKVGDYYSAWMNKDALNEKGAGPLSNHLNTIDNIENHQELVLGLADVHATAPFGIAVFPDPADTTQYTLFTGQAGLAMPDRKYYLSNEDRFVGFRAAYRDYVIKIQELAGIDDAASKADIIIALETRLAEAHWSPADNRDIQKIYNPMSLAQLAELAPEFDWAAALEYRGLNNVSSIVVGQPSAIQASAKIFAETPVSTWKNYLSYHFIRTNANNVSEQFDNAHFDFFYKTLSGIEDQRDRWKRGAEFVNNHLGEAVGQIYIDLHFPPEAKQQMDELVVNLLKALEERIGENEWMDEATKTAALAKLASLDSRIGYTSKWIDYDKLDIRPDDMLGNALRIKEFEWNRQVEQLAGPVDRQQWSFPPQTINASYSPLLNQITFPAGILQPPFFDPYADPAVNYGAIGGVIGHEIGHGFDDRGRRFDETGKLRDWWTTAADKAFKIRSGKLVEQYNGFSPIEGMYVDGELTLGENIGDLGGLEMAYCAYQRYKAEYGEPSVIDGFTGDQRFFMSWAQVWRAKAREDIIRQQLLTDPHSPPEYRINGVVRNIDAWYKAFDVQPDNAMYLPPEERVSIW